MTNKKTKGSITVFLSLVSVLVLALLCTLMESVYVDAGRIYFEETVSLCSEGISALYEKELWEDYGLLAFKEEDGGENAAGELALLLEKNLSKNGIQKEQDSGTKVGMRANLLPLHIDGVTAEECIYLLDDKGKWYQKEVTGLMKYEVAQDLLNQLKEALKEVSGVGVCMDVLQAEMTAQESLSAIADDMKKLSDIVKKINGRPVTLFCELAETIKTTGWSQGIGEEQIADIKQSFQDIQEECRMQSEYLQEAEEILASIQEKVSDAEKSIKDFKNALEKCREFLTDEMYQEFSEKLNVMENYAGVDSEQTIQSALKKDRAIMDAMAEVSAETFNDMNGQTLQEVFAKWEEQMQQYDIGELGKMTLYTVGDDGKEEGNPLTALQNLLKNGVLDLVADTDNLSEKILVQEKEDNDKNTGDIGDFFATAEELDFDTAALDSFSGLNQTLTSLSDAGNGLINRLLLCRYGTSYFSYYGYENPEEEKEQALLYEVEYQLAGKESDAENLRAVVNKLALIRTAMNYAYIKTDKEVGAQAKTVAAALAGIVGLEAFAGIIENALLLGLCYEEAIVDIAGMLGGRRIPFIKTKETFSMEFEQMAAFGKEMIQKKIKGLPDREAGITEGFAYDEYLLLLLLLTNKTKLIGRQCTLIQENLRLRYDREYQLANCLYAVQGTVSASLPEKFVRLKLPGKRDTEESGGYGYKTRWAYTY